MKRPRLIALLLLCLASTSAHAQWIRQNVNTTASLRGLSVVNEKIVWASGTGGAVIRTIDGGKTWHVITVPGAEKLDFRDIEAFDANTAYILSIGNGESSRIYKTIDGGKDWELEFKNTNEKAFFDAIACWETWRCIAMSDPVDGQYLLMSTGDGGANWVQNLSDPRSTPQAKEGEAAFAASGTCLITLGAHDAFVVSGGSDARVFRSEDRGLGWKIANTDITKGTQGSGIFSIAMIDAKNGVIVGGNYEKPDEHTNNLAFTTDGGNTWKLGTGLSGYRSGVTYVDRKTIIAVGTNGSDISRDGGETWLRIDGENYNGVQAKGKNAICAVGPRGYVAKLSWQGFLAINGYKPCPKNMICDAPSVNDLRLSHTEISSACLQTNSQCSDKRQIEVATVAVIVAPDVASNWYDYTVSYGQVIGFGANVTWDLSDAKPGTYTITSGLKIPYGDSFRIFGKTVTKQVIVK